MAEWKLTSDKKGTPVKRAKDVFHYVPEHHSAEMAKRFYLTRVRKKGRDLYAIGGARDGPEPAPLSEDEKLDLLDEAARDRCDNAEDPWIQVESEAAAFEHGMGIVTKD